MTMTPEQIKAWQAEHGGAGGDPEGPDSKGLVTHRATDGAWVVVNAQGAVISRGASPGSADPKTGIGTYTDDQIRARVARSPGLVYEGEKTRTVPGAYGMPPSTVKVVSWKDPKTGETVVADVNDDGTYSVTQDGGTAKPPTATTTRTPEQQRADAANATTAEATAARAKQDQAEREKNAAWPKDQDPAYETDDERRARGAAVIKQQGADAKAADDKARQDRLDAQAAQTHAQATATAAQNSETAAAREKREQEAAGRIQDPTTKQWLEKGPDGFWRPLKTEGVPSGAEPEGAPQPSGRLGEAAADLKAYEVWLNKQLRAVPPTLTLAQADAKREARRQFWQTALSEQQGVVNAQSNAYGQDINQRNNTLADLSNRRTSATQIANQATADWMPLATKLGNGPNVGKNFMAAIRESRNNAQDFVTQTGANRQVPEIVKGPALQTVNGMQLPGGAAMPNLSVRPNAIGLGNIGAVTQPSPATAAIRADPAGAAAAQATSQVAAAQAAPATAPLPVDAAPQSQMQAPPTFLAGMRPQQQQQPDPTSTIQALINDPDMDNAAVRQAVAEMYPGYPIDQLLGQAAA